MSFTGEGKFVTLPQKGWDRPYSELYRGGEICYVTPEGLGHSSQRALPGRGNLLRYPRRVGTDPIVSFTGEGKFVTLPQKGWDTPHSELYRGGEICYVTPEGLGQTL